MKRDRISQCVKRAGAMGLSYGQYIALLHDTKPSPPPKPKPDLLRACHTCGEIFAAYLDSQIYCCNDCRQRARNRRKGTVRRKKFAWERAMEEIRKRERMDAK